MTKTNNEQYGLISRADIDGKKTVALPAKGNIPPFNVYFDIFMPSAGDAVVSFVVETASERRDHGAAQNAGKACVRTCVK
jgi:hypothetical protein